MANSKATGGEGVRRNESPVQEAISSVVELMQFSPTYEPACQTLHAVLQEGEETNSKENCAVIEEIKNLQEKQKDVENDLAAIQSVLATAIAKGVLTLDEVEKMKEPTASPKGSDPDQPGNSKDE